MNGFNRVIEGMFSNFDPELVIEPRNGKTFSIATESMQAVKQLPEIAIFSESVQETAMIEYKEHQTAAIVKGVSDNYQQLVNIDSIVSDGEYCVYDGAFNRCVMGWALANQIGINAHFVGGVKMYAPKRYERVNMLRPDQSLNKEVVYIAGTFAVNQQQYDNQYVLTSLACARQLFDYAMDEVSSVEIRVADGQSVKQVQKSIIKLIGDDFQVLDRYQQQADFFRISQIEKLLCALLLAFILMIASFNIIGSLSMLMLEKKEDILVLQNLGASSKQIRHIFLYEGWMISFLGAMIGLIAGVAICLLQQEYGLLKLGNGYEYALSAYPVSVEVLDIVLITLIVLVMGFLAAWYPTRNIKNND